MKKIHIVILMVLFIALAFIFYRNYSSNDKSDEAVTASGEVFTIIMNDEGFSPSEVAVSKGTKIIWVNEGVNPHWPASNFHPTHGIYPEFDPLKGIPPGEEWSIVLKTGKWRFHDHLYPNLTGTLEVGK